VPVDTTETRLIKFAVKHSLFFHTLVKMFLERWNGHRVCQQLQRVARIVLKL